METYLCQEEDAALLTRVAMAESSFSHDDRVYAMWIIRLRMEIAYVRPLAVQGDKTSLKEEIFFANPIQFTTIPAMFPISDPRQAALGPNGDAYACGGYINGAIYPCDTSGLDGVDPDPDNPNAAALAHWCETYDEAKQILAVTSSTFLTSFPVELRKYDSFAAPGNGGVQFYPPYGNEYFNPPRFSLSAGYSNPCSFSFTFTPCSESGNTTPLSR